jgi:adenylate cyclase
MAAYRTSGPADEPLERELVLEEVVLGAPREYCLNDLAELAGLDVEEVRRLWRSVGFAEVSDDARLFTVRDLDAARALAQLPELGLFSREVREAVARTVAQAMSRLADWQVALIGRLFEAQGSQDDPEPAVAVSAEVLLALEKLQSAIWRRHLAAALHRFAANEPGAAGETRPLAVGFADMVGFTRTTRRQSATELGEMIERFSAATTEVIAEGHGRIVKTVGDEVLFVADEVARAAAIALGLAERVAAEPALPELRIGLAAGTVLVRFGDVYGEVVNIAARLTREARPGTVLVDTAVATALADDLRFALRRLRPVAVRGYSHLQPWLLQRGASEA